MSLRLRPASAGALEAAAATALDAACFGFATMLAGPARQRKEGGGIWQLLKHAESERTVVDLVKDNQNLNLII